MPSLFKHKHKSKQPNKPLELLPLTFNDCPPKNISKFRSGHSINWAENRSTNWINSQGSTDQFLWISHESTAWIDPRINAVQTSLPVCPTELRLRGDLVSMFKRFIRFGICYIERYWFFGAIGEYMGWDLLFNVRTKVETFLLLYFMLLEIK